MKKRWQQTIFIFILVSALFHLSVYTGLRLYPETKSVATNDNAVEITIVDPSQNKPQISTKEKLQVVDQNDKAINDEIPKNAQFLSQHNQTVKEQTRARNAGKFNNSAQKGANGAEKIFQVQQPSQQKTDRSEKKSVAENKIKSTAPLTKEGNLPLLKDFAPKFAPSMQAKKHIQQPVSAGTPSATSDYLKDLKDGPQTLLSTKEFVYFSYYKRIREKIRQYWEPSIKKKVEKIFAEGRSIASTTDKITRVVIILNRDGSLFKVQVIGHSGIRDLDDAAVEAFKAAEPFPNPPQGIIENDGYIRIHWDFVLEA